MAGTTVDSAVASRALMAHRTYTYTEGQAKVTEHHYELPKGQHSNLVGSFSYRTVSQKAGQLKARLAQESQKLKRQEVSDRKEGRISGKKRARIRGKIRYLQNELNAEIARSPITRVVVHERDDSEEPDVSGSLEAQGYDLLLSSRPEADAAGTETGGQE